MLKIQKLSLATLIVSAVVSHSVFAAEKTAFDENTASYAVGVLIGTQAKDLINSQKGVIKYNNARILDGLKDAIEGKVDLRKDEKIQQTLTGIEEKVIAAAQAKMDELSKMSKIEGDKYRAEFAKQPGVKKTKDGLLYKIISPGKGSMIKPTDIVKVNYVGKLTNGKVFDSSIARGQPVEFKLDQVVKGWTEGLQLVKKGGKIELVLPPELAYGDRGIGAIIPPNSTLYFEVEVLDVNPKTSK